MNGWVEPPVDREPEFAPRYRREYQQLLDEGLTNAEAEAEICARRGLRRGVDQKQKWTVRELLALEFTAYRTRDIAP